MILPEKDGRGDDKWRCRWESEGMWESSVLWKEKWKKKKEGSKWVAGQEIRLQLKCVVGIKGVGGSRVAPYKNLILFFFFLLGRYIGFV